MGLRGIICEREIGRRKKTEWSAVEHQQFIFAEGAVSEEAKRVTGVYRELRKCSSKNVSRSENCV